MLVWDGEGGGGEMDVGMGNGEKGKGRTGKDGTSSDDDEYPLPTTTTKARAPKAKTTTAIKKRAPPKTAPTKHRQPTSGSDSPGFVFPDDDSDDSTTPPPRPSTSAAPPPPPPGMPDYASWNLAVLQSQVSQYGYRISKERSVLVAQLTKVWCAINLPAGVAKPARKPRAKPAKKKKVLVSDAEDGDGEDEEGEQETVGERLRKLILADDELYMKVLRYEPIFFDEIVALAAANGIKAAKPLLMRCLDEQCVTFFTQDPASGTRKRYR